MIKRFFACVAALTITFSAVPEWAVFADPDLGGGGIAEEESAKITAAYTAENIGDTGNKVKLTATLSGDDKDKAASVFFVIDGNNDTAKKAENDGDTWSVEYESDDNGEHVFGIIILGEDKDSLEDIAESDYLFKTEDTDRDSFVIDTTAPEVELQASFRQDEGPVDEHVQHRQELFLVLGALKELLEGVARVGCHLQAPVLQQLPQPVELRRLGEGLAAGEGDAPAQGVAPRDLRQGLHLHGGPHAKFPGLRVVAPGAVVGTALGEKGGPDARSVHNGIGGNARHINRHVHIPPV